MRYRVIGVKQIHAGNVILRIINDSEYYIFNTIQEAEDKLYELGFMDPPNYKSDYFVIEQIL